MSDMVDESDTMGLFLVLDAELREGETQVADPELSGVPAAFLARLEELEPTWRALGFDTDHIYAAAGWGRIWVAFDLVDRAENAIFGSVRVDVSDDEWLGGWVSPSLSDQIRFPDADPRLQTGGRVTDPEQAIEAAIGWLTTQLRSPIVRHVWREGGNVVAESWRLEETGDDLIVSGSPEVRRREADEKITVRP